MDTASMIGQQFGNYVVQRLLGEGGMGAVFLAENPAIGRQVAIKVLPPELTHQAENVERFLAEAKAVASVDHHNVIDIYDFGTSEAGQVYYVMERLKGRDLADVLRQRGRLSVAEALPYVEQICAALEAVHQRGVVHRDLKPSNIFVVEGDSLLLKLLDFGLAKLTEPSIQSELTATGAILGTPVTMAPEQAASQPELLGAQTDLYALGVILFWMLAGRPPFNDGAPMLIVSHHIMKPPPRLEQLQPSVPLSIARLVDQCLAKRPVERPASAAEVARRFAEGLGVQAESAEEREQPDGPGGAAVSDPALEATLAPDVGQSGAPSNMELERTMPSGAAEPLYGELLAQLGRRPSRSSTRRLLAAAATAVVITALLILLGP